ncbi:tRNA synthetases class I-domain-containing protein [Limtongia smithiae]|uniref:tRNA synthetases class I-domain-containing protein n=1 Tax=Limtongia smithiae TaxID=1125753 RepID=UPI0034CF59B3
MATEAAAPVIPPKQKTEKELEKERKKAEKIAKFLEKEKKKQAAKSEKTEKVDKPTKKEEAAEVPEYVELTPVGEKKILQDLETLALKSYNPQIVESRWYEWWEKEGFFKPQFGPDGKIKPEGLFSIPAPPPNITGALHIGHALTASLQDALIRFERMRGKTVLYLPGFDHAGISTQSVVEKMIWKNNKETRHDYGREKFVDLVWAWKHEYYTRIKDQSKRLGASYDWTREAFTMDENLSRAVRKTFIDLFEDGTIYRDNRLVNWCVALTTTLSNLEVENKDIKGRTMLSVPGYSEPVEFGVITSFAYPVEGLDEKLIVATTRPETMFGDTAVAVHPDDARYKHLHGKFVLHPFLERRIPIITDAEAVDMEFGTGAVKITPAHDPNDYATGKRHGLEFINILNDDGTLNANCGEWEGIKRFDARKLVLEKLKEKGLFIETKENEMSIPLCAKSNDVIEPIMKPQWWVRQKEMADAAMNAIKTGEMTLEPKTFHAEYFYWLQNIQDWCVSRQLWWGHRIPMYFVRIEGEEAQDPVEEKWWVAGESEEEAAVKAAAKFPGKKFTLEWDEDVLDTWFSSGLWPFSTLGWPQDGAQDYKDFYPMSMLETGWDIMFFWVARMAMMGIKLTGSVPFKEIYLHSLIRDAQGRKMSKSLGNVIDPLDVTTGKPLQALHAKLREGNLDPREIKKAEEGQKISFPNGIPECGTDAMRFALCAYTTGSRDINLDILRIEGYRKFCNKIYQATKFALLRLGDGYTPPAEIVVTGQESLVEKWILYRFSEAARMITTALEKRDFIGATTAVYNFWLYELCDVYIENSKTLFMEGNEAEQASARNTLYTCLDGALKLIHPFMPFITEELWQRLPRRANDVTQTIVLAQYPTFREELDAFAGAAAEYDLVFAVVKNARSLLTQYGILKGGKIYVQVARPEDGATIEAQTSSIGALIKAYDTLEVLDPSASFPEGTGLAVVSAEVTVGVLLKGYVDAETEIRKAESRLGKTQQSKAALEKTMSNKDYETKAKPEAKVANAEKLKTLEAEIESLEGMIRDFEKLRA